MFLGKPQFALFIAVTVLMSTSAVSVFASTYEDYGNEYLKFLAGTANCSIGAGSNDSNFGYNTSQYQIVTYRPITSDMYLSAFKATLSSVGGPSDTVVALVFRLPLNQTFGFSESDVVATSTSVVVTTENLYSFSFASSTFLSRGTYVFALRRTGVLSTSNYYQIFSYNSCYVRGVQSVSSKLFTNTNSNAGNLSGTSVFAILGDVIRSEGTSNSSSSTDIDMASTTNAIIWAGHMNQMYLGIFLFLIMLVFSYTFTRKYL